MIYKVGHTLVPLIKIQRYNISIKTHNKIETNIKIVL